MHALSSPSQQLSKHTIRYAIHHNTRRFQHGFSLLELVVVMGILAIFASVSLTFVGEKDVQQRYQQSIEKLQAVKRNFFSVDKFQGQTVMHGFFVDNGMGVTQSFSIILKNKLESSATYDIDKASYKPFSLIEDIYIEDSENNLTSQKIEGAGLYKGIRPGAYDLSEYQDSDSEIRDAWGDEFGLESDSIKIDTENKDYKNLAPAKSSIDISYNDLVISASFIKVYVENLPSTGDFRVAIASFKNSEDCKDDLKDCWTTTLSNEISTTPSGHIFTVKEIVDNGLIFNNEDIKSITPAIDASTPEKLTNLTLTADNDKTWQITELAPTNTFTFPSTEISIGSHVVVLLEKDTSTTPETWKIYNIGTSADPIHIFEYLHIFPGQIPEPITLSIP